MYKKKVISILLIILIMLLSFTQSAYAAICEITIEDSNSNTGFIEKDGKLYYIVAVKTKTIGAYLSGIAFDLKYDREHLAPLKLDGKELNLGNFGSYDETILVQYDKNWNTNINGLTYQAQAKVRDTTSIDDNEVTLLTACFQVLDGKKEKRAVYIDTEDGITEVPGILISTKDRYITNGFEQADIEKIDSESDKTSTGEIKIEYGDGEIKEVETEYTSQVKEQEENAKEASKNAEKLKEEGIAVDKIENETGTAKESDKTLAKTILPATGIGTIIGIVILLSIIAIISYKKMKKYKKIK